MRTRFHSPAFFNNPTTTTASFHLLPLPPQPTPPPPTFSLTESLLSFLNHAPPLSDLAVPTLQFQSALSTFYSDVVPQYLDLSTTSLLLDEASMAGDDRLMIDPEVFESTSKLEQKTGFDHHIPELEFVQFEVPQHDVLTVNTNIFEEMLNVLPELESLGINAQEETMCELQIPNLSQKSVYLVDSIQFDYQPHKETCVTEHDGCFPNDFHRCAFPCFEVDDVILETSSEPTPENELVTLFRCMELEYQNQGDYIASDVNELLPSTCISLVDSVQIDHENFEMEGTDLVLDKDFICVKEQSACSLEKSGVYYYIAFDPYHEIQFFEIISYLNTDIYSEYTKADEPLNLGSLMQENLGFSTCDELIVSHELVLADDMFRSLPVPIISECEATVLTHDCFWKVLSELKPQSLSVSIDIYLDWHLLDDHKIDTDTSGICEKLLMDLDHQHAEFESSLYDRDMSVLSMISEDTAISSGDEECKESLNLVSGSCHSSLSTIPVMDSGKGLPRIPISDNGGITKSKCADMETILKKSLPQFNDLEFFLNPQEDTLRIKRVSQVEQNEPFVSGPCNYSNDSFLLDTLHAERLCQWDIKIHPVPLSDSNLTLISYFQKYYLAILENITLLQTMPSFSFGDKSKLLRFTKQELVNEIGGLIALSPSSRDENIWALLTLCAIKQMSWYLCFYGIHATQSYVHTLCSTVDFLRLRLCFLQSLISDALSQTTEDITRSHPSLAKISEILRSKPSDSESKILIVVEEVLWHPLKLLLTSIGLSVKEIQNYKCTSYHQDPCSTPPSIAACDVLLNADCIIVSHKSISETFPFHKFALILEYGGSHDSSRLTCLPKPSTVLPPLNFLKMELEPANMLKVFCENSELPFSLGTALVGQATSLLQTHGSITLQKLEQVLNLLPDGDEIISVPSGAKEACTVSSSISMGAKDTENYSQSRQHPYKNIVTQMHEGLSTSKDTDNYSQSRQHPYKNFVTQMHEGLSTCPKQLIVMNTQNLNKEMIVSKQSTYQRILSLEKEHVQVVERDSSLPADIIITASMCLVWYDSRNISSIVKQTEAAPCLSLCLDDIATNVLMHLSFAFTCCYLVFEGNHNFTSSISEYADGLYAAATSLGIDIQLLYSHSSESTGEIILNCIRCATRFTKYQYPPMPESETFGECLLTKFPSINSLSAHAIICSVNSLVDFFQMSRKVRLQALKKYNVPEVSINLLSILCKFGEKEDTRSGTTDCSSSVSSASESEYFHYKLGLGGTKCKFNSSLSKDGMIGDDSLQYEPLKTAIDAGLNPQGVAEQFLSTISFDTNEPAHLSKPSSSLYNMSFGSHVEGRSISGNQLCTETLKGAYTMKKSFGEADFDTNVNFGKKLFPFEKTRTLPPISGKRKAPESRNPRIARRLSFDAISNPTFPMVCKADFDFCGEKSGGDYEYEGTETNDMDHISNLESHGTASKFGHDDREGGHEPNAKRFYPPTYQEARISHYGDTPLRAAIDSFKLQQGSPWTIEFLNRVREKSRAHQNSLSCGAFPTTLGQRGNKHHTKRKSPSIIDFYRYQGGGSAHKSIQRKTRLKENEPASFKERDDLSAMRTPIDKRARKALSFTMGKHGSQSKLVWRDRSI